jgi:thiol-disulfide isomerase/thioredoxin
MGFGALAITLRLALGLVLAVAAITKLASHRESRRAVEDFGIPRRLARPLAFVIPIAELVTAIAFIPPSSARWAGVGAMAMLTIFTVATAVALLRGRRPECHCFGQLQSASIGPGTIARNMVLLGAAAFVAWQGGRTTWDGPSFGKGSPATSVVVIGTLVFLAMLGALALFILNLARQNGRLLIRLENVERMLASHGERSLSPSSRSHQSSLGNVAPTFLLRDRTDEFVSLEDVRLSGLPVLLVFMEPECRPCRALSPLVARWHREHSDLLTIAVITPRPDLVPAGPLVLDQEKSDVATAFGVSGTPSAVLVDAYGLIASDVVTGREGIEGTVKTLVADRRRGAPILDGTARQHRVGEPCPAVTLRDLDDRPFNFAQQRDHPVVAAFWNPRCSFCHDMLDDVRAFESAIDDRSELVLVSSGSIEDNLAMGLRSPVLLDPDSLSARAFGATGTPMALVVDAEGRIASSLASGRQGVLYLLRAVSRGAGTARSQLETGSAVMPGRAR